MPAFNVRVYGILLHSGNVLVSDEIIRGKFYTKFPGGGLEFGEGTRDCLKREFLEETGLIVDVTNHLYTTDFFQVSAFNPDHQIISIYYNVHTIDFSSLITSNKKFGFTEDQLSSQQDCEIFRWIPIKELSADDLTLPIDKKIADILNPSLR